VWYRLLALNLGTDFRTASRKYLEMFPVSVAWLDPPYTQCNMNKPFEFYRPVPQAKIEIP
jgi:hypothetical protein